MLQLLLRVRRSWYESRHVWKGNEIGAEVLSSQGRTLGGRMLIEHIQAHKCP